MTLIYKEVDKSCQTCKTYIQIWYYFVAVDIQFFVLISWVYKNRLSE